MKITLRITFLGLILINCSSVNESDKLTDPDKEAESVYFEGEIHYSIEYDSVPPNLTPEHLTKALGSKMILVFKNGNHRKDYFSPSGRLISQRYLNLKKQKAYSIQPGEDTVLWFNITQPDSRTTYTKLKDTIVNNYECITISAKTFTPNPKNNTLELELNSTYYSAIDLKVNPDWFVNYNEANYKEMIKLTKSLVVEKYEKGPFWNTRAILDTVIWRKVISRELAIEKIKHKTLKEL